MRVDERDEENEGDEGGEGSKGTRGTKGTKAAKGTGHDEKPISTLETRKRIDFFQSHVSRH